jgi:uncharacterized membrane protein YfhO
MRKRAEESETQMILLEDTPQRVQIRVQVSASGTLVLADTFYPGWKCFVDGVEREIRPAHGTFRAVDLDRDAREVVFSYAPASFRAGMIASVVGIALWFLLASVALRRAYRSRGRVERSGQSSDPRFEASI